METACRILRIRGWERDDGKAREADRCGIAEDAGAGLSVVCAGNEGGHGGAWEEQVVEGLEEGVGRCTEGVELMVETREFGCGYGSAPGEAFGDHGFEVVEVTLVEGGCFTGLDRGKDRCGVGPVGGVEGVDGCVLGLKTGLPEI